MANTFVELNDTPSNYTGSGAKYLQVDGPEGNVIFNNIDLNNLADVNAPAPGGNQVLQWVSAANEWRAVTYAPYSAGNGINFGGTGYVINAVAGSGGGLTSNTSGIYITDIANVSGTYGNATYTPQLTVNSKGQITGVAEVQSSITLAESLNASYVGNVIGTSGQITVTGGTGINSNATLNLVATGVTAGIYGNATAIPKITVDSYGRISSVDVVDVVASGGSGNADLSNVTTLAYSNIHVSGQTSLGADRKDDDLTFAGGLAIDATTDANTDTISFALNPTDAAANMSISGFSDVDASGITNGQALIWNSSTNKFEAGNVSGGDGNSNVTLTDFSVTTATPSGNGSLTYDNAGVFTFTPANVQAGGGSTQSLSWESANSNLTISSGNSVDLSALSQTLSVAGNVITISGSSDTVDLTSALGNVAGNYGDSNVASYLSANGYSNVDVDAQDLSITGNVISLTKQSGNVDLTELVYANTKVQAYLDAQSYANTAYVDALETKIIGGANVNLDSLAEVANALANSNTELSTVAFTGTFSDLQTRPTISLAGSDLTYDGTTLDLSGVGAQGPQGNAGADGVSVTSATLSSDNLILTLSNASTIDAGNVRGPVGPTGATGPQGDGNAGISSATITAGNLVLTLNDSTTIDAGNVKGDTGDTGASGVGITSTALVGGNLTLTYSNTSTQDVGNIQGPQGDAGTNGVDVSSATVNGSGNLIIT
jgi:collagen type VII alpha